MRNIFTHPITLLFGAFVAQWLLEAIVASPQVYVIVLAALVIHALQTSTHHWIWYTIAAGLTIDLISLQPLGIWTVGLLIAVGAAKTLFSSLSWQKTRGYMLSMSIMSYVFLVTTTFLLARLTPPILGQTKIPEFAHAFTFWSTILEILILIVATLIFFTLENRPQKHPKQPGLFG